MMTAHPGICDVCGRPTNCDGDWLCAEHAATAETVAFEGHVEEAPDGDAAASGE